MKNLLIIVAGLVLAVVTIAPVSVPPITGDGIAVALDAPPTPPDEWKGADQGEVVPPRPPRVPRPDPLLICEMVVTGDAIHYEFTGERAPWPEHDPIVRGCRWLDQQQNRLLQWLLDQGGRLGDRLTAPRADYYCTTPYFKAAGYCPTPTPGPEYPVTPGPTPTPPKLVDDTGHARDSNRDPQCAHDRTPVATGHCTADGKWVSPTPTSDTTATPTPTRVPPPSSTPTPTATPNLYRPYVPPPPPPTPEPTPEPTPTPNPDPPKPRPRLLNNHCVEISMRAAVRGHDPGQAYLACMAEGGWTP